MDDGILLRMGSSTDFMPFPPEGIPPAFPANNQSPSNGLPPLGELRYYPVAIMCLSLTKPPPPPAYAGRWSDY